MAAPPPGGRQDTGDSRWHGLGLLDENIKSLKKQIEVLAQELRSAVAERDTLLSELGVLQWPGLERDSRFLLKLPGTARRCSADWRGGACEFREGEDAEERLNKHRRGQSWAGWEHRTGQTGPAGRRCGRDRTRSMESANTAFGGDLPSHRGPSPVLGALLETCESSAEGQELGECSDGGEGSVSIPRVLSSISEKDFDPMCGARDDPETRICTPDSSSTLTEPETHRDSESPSEEPIDNTLQPEDDAPEDPSRPRRWLSNSAFHRTQTDSPVPSAGVEDPPPGMTPHHPHVRMRTTHVALVERANRAARLSKELFQARFALHDSQSQLQFLTERMMMYKNNFQEEVKRHEEEAHKLRGMLNEATTSKFIMFCKLSECQEKMQKLEEELVLSQALSEQSHSVTDESLTGAEACNEQVLERIDSARSPGGGQSWFRGCSMSTLERGTGKLDQNVVGSKLQRRLTETMRLLLAAQSRGDKLQQRLREAELQLKKRGEETRSCLPSERSSGSGSCRSIQNRTWNELKQTRVELKRTRVQLRKCEEELSVSNKIRHQQESDIGKLRLELKEARRRKPPKWR